MTTTEKTKTNVVHHEAAGLLYVTVTGRSDLSESTVTKRANSAITAWRLAQPEAFTVQKTTQRHTVPFSTSGRTVNTFYYTAKAV